MEKLQSMGTTNLLSSNPLRVVSCLLLKCTLFHHDSPVIKGEMRGYQLQGLNWMVSLHHNGLNGILADEMARRLLFSLFFSNIPFQGLGKTLQTISFLAYLKHYRDISGPHLVVVPKSTLQNWHREFQQWTPDFDLVMLTGTKDERAEIIATRLITQSFQVCITTYEMCLIETAALKKFSFEYIVIDEAHRIKNVDSILSQIVRAFISRGRLLITGTPLQNNLKELFSLLNFICPEIFVEYKDLDGFLHKDSQHTDVEEEASKKVVEALHKILRPFLLRRVKSDVEKSLLPSTLPFFWTGDYSEHVPQKRRSISTWGWPRCKGSGIAQYLRKI